MKMEGCWALKNSYLFFVYLYHNINTKREIAVKFVSWFVAYLFSTSL